MGVPAPSAPAETRAPGAPGSVVGLATGSDPGPAGAIAPPRPADPWNPSNDLHAEKLLVAADAAAQVAAARLDRLAPCDAPCSTTRWSSG